MSETPNINIQPAYKTQIKGFKSGTHRLVSPSETLANYSPYMPEMGITRLANVTGLDSIGLPVVIAVRPNSESLSVSQGKGLTLEAAKASALMESIESWHGENLKLELKYTSAQNLIAKGGNVVNIEDIPMQFGAAARLNEPLLWVEADSLFSNQKVWVPYECISTNFNWPRGYEPKFAFSTNGLASGNSTVEATIHGICEIIERDAISLWELCLDEVQKKKRQIRLDSIKSDLCTNYIRKITEQDIVLGLWNISSDIGIPVIKAVIVSPNGEQHWRSLGSFSGYGCHLSKEVAIVRAVSEAIQSRLTFISGSRDDILYEDYAAQSSLSQVDAFRESIVKEGAQEDYASISSLSTHSLNEDLDILMSQLKSVGVNDVIRADLMHEKFNIPVVKMVIPGLESGSLMRGYSPGKRVQAFITKNKSS